ncbi:MAG: ankyrin repeat domain-containing protein [Parachlamydia sp.]|nr:ankyrin repeat domain-containing protein [Parachlamydia sp.]
MNIQVEPITLRQHLLNPFSFKVHGAKTYTALIPVSRRIAALVAAVATAFFGLSFAVVGGPIVFYFFTRLFKSKRIEQIRQSNVPVPPAPNPEPVRRLPPIGIFWTPLHDACARGQLNLVRSLIASRASLSSIDRDGNTPLHVAAMHGHHAIVQLLVANAASSGYNFAGKSPLTLAVERVIPSIGAGRYTDTRALLTLICNSPHARGNVDRLVETLKPFAKLDVVRLLMQFPNYNSVATGLLVRLMISLLRDQHFEDTGNPVAFNRKVREQPFIFSVQNDEVLVHILVSNEPVTVPLTKQQFYHVWVQAEGNLNQIQTRVLEARDRPIQVPAIIGPNQPAAVFGIPAVAVGIDGYRINVSNREDFKNNPDTYLDMVSKQFDQEKRYSLKVHFDREPGADAGGLRRQFIADLFSHISTKLQFHRYDNGLYRPRSPNAQSEFPCLNAKDKKICQNLGKMIMFCLNASESYPTGQIFDPGVFVALAKMDPRLLDKKFEEINFKDQVIYDSMFGIYKAMNLDNEDERKGIERMEGYLALTATSSDKALQEAYGSVMAEDDIEKLNIDFNNVAQIRPHLAAIKAAVKNSIIESMRATFAPIHAIAAGMKNSGFNRKVSFDDLRGKTPADLSKELQGETSKQCIIDKLNVYASFNTRASADNIKTWLTSWINKASTEKLKLFLYATTGTYALGRDTRITIGHSQGFAFHTCSCKIDLNYDMVSNEADLGAMLEAHMDLIKKNAGFNAL